MDPALDRHQQAALRHEQAASRHDRAATFWDQLGEREQAGLQRELGDHERHAAELERRWARLMDREPAARSIHGARSITQTNAERLSSELERTAAALEHTAAIAENMLGRESKPSAVVQPPAGIGPAEHARDVARRARTQAEEWRKLAKHP